MRMPDKYSRAQQLLALTRIKTAQKKGTVDQIPEWMFEARREYYRNRNFNRYKSRYRVALKEDGIVDWLAIEIAVSGVRIVQLTHTERTLAAGRMLRAGLEVKVISERLGIDARQGARLLCKIRNDNAEGKILLALATDQFDQSAA